MLQEGFLDRLTPRMRGDVLGTARPMPLLRGTPLFLTGDEASCAYVVTRGAVKLTRHDLDGRECGLAIALPGRMVGASALLQKARHRHDAVASTRGSALVLTSQLFERILARPEGAPAVASEMASWSDIFEDAAGERTARVSTRVAGRLLELADAMGRDGSNGRYLDVPVPFSELAELAAMSRETMSKTLHRFRRDGLIDLRGRTLRIRRRDVLERIRCGERASGPCRSTDAEDPALSRSSSGS